MMPFMDGLATIRALRKLTPELKISCASGIPSYVRPIEVARSGVQRFLP